MELNLTLFPSLSSVSVCAHNTQRDKAMSWQKRAARDIKELNDAGLPVRADSGEELDMRCFRVDLKGPEGTPYEGFVWALRFTLPEQFPFRSPSIGFVERILHPNVDEASGSVCLDSLNKGWSASFTLRHITEDLLPYLLRYPNPADPLNREAAVLLTSVPLPQYEAQVKAHAKRHARPLETHKT